LTHLCQFFILFYFHLCSTKTKNKKIIKTIILISLLFANLFANAQTPEKQGLIEYKILHKKDTIHFYIYNPKKISKEKIFLYLQGTGAYPMVNGDNNGECCMNNFPKKLMIQFPDDYAFVYIKKNRLALLCKQSKF
jgi:hypothetical protein